MRNPIILCSTRRSHYAIENEIRYELNPTLILKLREYLKENLKKNAEDIVSRWVANLPESTQREIRVFPFHNMVA
jgi:predicted metal-dependent hydrolase